MVTYEVDTKGKDGALRRYHVAAEDSRQAKKQVEELEQNIARSGGEPFADLTARKLD